MENLTITNCVNRLWLLEGRGKKSKALMKCKSGMGLRATPTCCEYSRDGLLVACGCQDGSIQMWDHRKSFVNVALMLRDAHQVCPCGHFTYLVEDFEVLINML